MEEEFLTREQAVKKLGLSYKISSSDGITLIEETFGLGDNLLKSIKVLMFKNEYKYNVKKKNIKKKFKRFFSLYGYLYKQNLNDEINILDNELIYLNTHIKIKYIPTNAKIKFSSNILAHLDRQMIITNKNMVLRYPFNKNKEETIIFCDININS